MSRRQRTIEAWNAALNEAAANGLRPNGRPARAHAWATAVLAWEGFGFPGRPDITSGFRSPAEQAELIAQWESGQRAGLRARPAECSWHISRRAVDVERDVRGFDRYRQLLTQYTGARDGCAFGDCGHFDWPTDGRQCV